ncbi:MAG: DUF1963 domain-containing protein [Oscillospiraceae bacterium]|nr:DUF1963 domain-containing protein [Oscillospiraceae bacterium]
MMKEENDMLIQFGFMPKEQSELSEEMKMNMLDMFRNALTNELMKHDPSTGEIFADKKPRTFQEMSELMGNMVDSLNDMGLYDNIDREKPVKAQRAEPKYNIKDIIERIDNELGSRQMLKFNTVITDTDIFDSKIGGVPYMPKDFEYPMGKGNYEGMPLQLIAQLNFERLPHIKDFPEKGILQFFGSPNDADYSYGMDYDELTLQNGFRVIYHENIITDRSMLLSAEDMPPIESVDFPFDENFTMLLEPVLTECKPTANCFEFYSRLLKYCGERCGCQIRTIKDMINNGFSKDEIDGIFQERRNETTCMGGYPDFTQDDPRFDEKYADCDILLFQSVSENYIMWGDCGIGSFFIPRDRLKALDFSRVIFTWDCC